MTGGNWKTITGKTSFIQNNSTDKSRVFELETQFFIEMEYEYNQRSLCLAIAKAGVFLTFPFVLNDVTKHSNNTTD